MRIDNVIDIEIGTTKQYQKAGGYNRRDWHYNKGIVIIADGFLTIITSGSPSPTGQEIFRSFPLSGIESLAGYTEKGGKFEIS